MRLIDADALLEAISKLAYVEYGVAKAIANAPTVQREVPESIKELIRNQQPLPTGMQKILHDNLSELYEGTLANNAPNDTQRLDFIVSILNKYELSKSRWGYTLFTKALGTVPIVENYYPSVRDLLDAAFLATLDKE